MAMLEGLSRFEVRMLSLALVGLGACGLLLSSDPITERLFKHNFSDEAESQSSSEGPEKSNLAAPVPIEGDPLQLYIWKLDDFYQKDGDVWRPRAEAQSEVVAKRKLVWTHDSSGPFLVQISQDPEFSFSRDFKTSSNLILELDKLKVGQTFWRVSGDGKRWSDAKSFKVEAKFLDSRTAVSINQIGNQFVELFLQAPGNEYSFAVEISQDEGFSPARTETKLSNGSRLRQTLTSGRYFVRARAMNSIQEITEISPVVSFVVP